MHEIKKMKKSHDDGIFPLLRHLAPPPNTNDDIEHSPAQGGITVEGDLEQLNGDSVRSDSISVRQRADGVWSAPASWAELLAACFRATGQGLLRCSGQASMT